MTRANDEADEVAIRITPARKAVLDLISKSKRPLSHNDIFPKLSKFDRVTIYRALDALENVKLLTKIHDSEGSSRFCATDPYEHKTCSGDHIHFQCTKCSVMTCLSDQKLPWVKPPKGCTVKSKQFITYGICSKCS